MNTKRTFSSMLGLLGLAALALYVLACTSFSPDDSKVLFPTYDPKAKDFAVAMYDRATGKPTTLLVAQQPAAEDEDASCAWVRPQWLQDGKHILVGWTRDQGDEALDLAVLPFGYPGTTRFFHLAGLEGGGGQLTTPLATAGEWLFLRAESNVLVRVDLLSGEVKSRVMPKAMTPYAAPGGTQAHYLCKAEDAEDEWEFGRIEPASLALEPVTKFKLKVDSDEGGFHAISPDGRWVAAVTEAGEGQLCVVLLENGVETRRVPLSGEGERLKLGGLTLSGANQAAYAAYLQVAEGETNASLGVVEIPLTQGKPRRTVLVKRAESRDEERVFYCAPSVSHDGKTLALATTYFAAGDKVIAAEDCALFLVDLADPGRRLTRVPVPLPPEEMD